MGFFQRCLGVSLCLFVALSAVKGFKFFQTQIPNGDRIPHPCISGEIWHGVGHESAGGGGPRNPFGKAFNANGKKWNRTLCMQDSDGDGKTNGEELGDPSCIWTPGDNPTRTSDLSHPGICDPYNSAECTQRNSFVKCDSFQCDAIGQSGTKKHSIKMPETKVPPRETTYQCMPFAFPDDASYHMVAYKPNIDNWNVMHHIVIYGCSNEKAINDTDLNKSYDCFMGDRDGCNEFLAIWALGMDGYCYPDEAGLRVGQGGYKRAIMELHWNNPMQNPDFTDASGIDFYLTTQTRPNNAGVLMIGENRLFIPPDTDRYEVKGNCPSDCTNNFMAGDINVFAVTNHMHLLGAAATSQVVIPNQRVTPLAQDDTFDYNRPVMYSLSPNVVVKPGHKLEMTCVFNSTSRTLTTTYGDGTNDEMCFAFLFYYPAENVGAQSCASNGIIDFCLQEEGEPLIANGCNFEAAFNVAIPQVAQRFQDIFQRCSMTMCYKECKEYIKKLRVEEPCYNEENIPYSKEFLLQSPESMVEIRDLWLRVGSCDAEIAREDLLANLPPRPNDDTSAATGISTTFTLTLSALVIGLGLLCRHN